MKLPMYQIDAFGRGAFTGNPAAVVPLESWPDDTLLQQIAEENNLSETAYIIQVDEKTWELRWFTPETEVALCGHATLGAAHAICEHIAPGTTHIVFKTRQSGELIVDKTDGGYEMSFPAIPTTERELTDDVVTILGCTPQLLLQGNYTDDEYDLVARFDSQADVEKITPNLDALLQANTRGLIATAPGDEVDFVSRYFAPEVGVPEDPVTGSAHCVLTTYWAQELGKDTMSARQLSKRGGWVEVQLQGDKVLLSGNAHTYLVGEIFV